MEKGFNDNRRSGHIENLDLCDRREKSGGTLCKAPRGIKIKYCKDG